VARYPACSSQEGWVLSRLTDAARAALTRGAERKAFRRALERALCAFNARHPGWQAAMLDASFLEHGAAPVLAHFVDRRGALPDAAVIAAAWAQQFPGTISVALVDEAEECVTDLLEEFRRQLTVEKALQGFLDRLAWDRTAASSQRIAEEVELLARDATRERITAAINGLSSAALTYQAAAEAHADHVPARHDDYRLQARIDYDTGRRALIFMSYPGVDLLVARFRELVLDPYEDALDAVDGGGDPADAVTALEESVAAFLRLLDEEVLSLP
jgi:hypothetical protein